MFTETYTKAVLMVIATALMTIALNPTPAFAQASVGAFTLLSQEQKFYYVSGYLDGFALAAQMPTDRTALLQRCFADFGTAKTVSVFEAWIARNPEDTTTGMDSPHWALCRASRNLWLEAAIDRFRPTCGLPYPGDVASG